MRLQIREQPSRLMQIGAPLLALVATTLTGWMLFSALQVPTLQALQLFFIYPLQDTYSLSELGLKATPLILCAVGLSLCYKAKLWNIGAEGHFVIGGITGSAVALAFNDSAGAAALLLAIIAGGLGGAVWAGIAAALKVAFGCNETLTTIMLNYIAVYSLLWAVYGPLQNNNGFGFPESELFNDHLLMPLLHEEYRINIGFIIALASLLLLWFINTKSMFGFQLDTLGESLAATRYAGFNSSFIIITILSLSGALAGLAGFIEVSGTSGQLTPHLPVGYGYAAIIVVYIGRHHPIGILLAALLISLMFIGGENLQLELGLPSTVGLMFQGLMLIYLLVAETFVSYRLKLPLTKALH